MRLKYKKVILFTTMIAMGISLLTFSLNEDKEIFKFKDKNNSNKNERLYTKDNEEQVGAEVSSIIIDNDESSVEPFNAIQGDNEENLQVTPEPTPEPTPTMAPIYDLEKNAIPKVNDLISEYFLAKINCDTDKMKELLTDTTGIKKEEVLQKETEHIEDFRNITVYTKKGLEEGSYLAYVYHEVKFTSINTLAPGLSKFYVITDDEGELKIFSGQLEDETAEYNIARNEDEDVVKLIKKTKKKGNEAKEKDQDLAEFWKSIDKLAKNNSK